MIDFIKEVHHSDKNDCDAKIHCKCNQNIGCDQSEPQHPFPQTALLSCGQGGRAAFTNVNDPSTIVGRVIIDTRGIPKPTVGIQFSSVINFLALFTGAVGRLDFELFRACDNSNPMLLNTWTYEIFRIEGAPGDFDAFRFSKSFGFNFCECASCTGLCEYFVKVSVTNVFVATLLVDNVHITALAQ